ncbi:MAG: hypothetical protein AABX23_00950 [Nanoarchaeota archaeon]
MPVINKRGFSSIIQVTILSALSVVSLFLIWAYLADLSSDLENKLSPTVECISQKSKVLNACVNQDGKIEVNLDIGLDEEINYIDLNFEGQSFSCGQSCGSCTLLDQEGKKKIYLQARGRVEDQSQLAVAINRCIPEIFTVNLC